MKTTKDILKALNAEKPLPRCNVMEWRVERRAFDTGFWFTGEKFIPHYEVKTTPCRFLFWKWEEDELVLPTLANNCQRASAIAYARQWYGTDDRRDPMPVRVIEVTRKWFADDKRHWDFETVIWCNGRFV